MNGRCPRCQASTHGLGDAESLCSTHALQVLDEIVDELIADMRERPARPDDEPELD